MSGRSRSRMTMIAEFVGRGRDPSPEFRMTARFSFALPRILSAFRTIFKRDNLSGSHGRP
jgi:hypothetical protein